ncbi:MAG: hypothetical protein RR585_15845, partial [Coprobacillus sp.]
SSTCLFDLERRMQVQNILRMYYGIDVTLEDYGYFSYQQQLYYFCYVADVQHFLDIYRYYRYLMHMCGCQGYHIVKNNNQDIISDQHILFMYHPGEFSFPVYLQVFLQPVTMQKIKIIDVKEQWIQKIDCVREHVKDYAYSFKHDQDVISLIYYYCGIAENSIYVLNEILNIHKEATITLSLSLSQPIPNYVYEILNPCHYIFSSRSRELVCLLRSHLLSYHDLQGLLESQYYDVYEILYLFARTLYPSSFFDAILNKQMTPELAQDFYSHLQEEKEMYKEIMRILSFYVRLPKISWINNQNMV